MAFKTCYYAVIKWNNSSYYEAFHFLEHQKLEIKTGEVTLNLIAEGNTNKIRFEQWSSISEGYSLPCHCDCELSEFLKTSKASVQGAVWKTLPLTNLWIYGSNSHEFSKLVTMWFFFFNLARTIWLVTE